MRVCCAQAIPYPPPLGVTTSVGGADAASGFSLVACGAFHNVLVTASGEVLTCGDGTNGPSPAVDLKGGGGGAAAGRTAHGAGRASSHAAAGAAQAGRTGAFTHVRLPPTTTNHLRPMEAAASTSASGAGAGAGAGVGTNAGADGGDVTSVSIVALAAGHAHSAALNGGGTLHTWGSNEFGQLGYASLAAAPGGGPSVPLDPGLQLPPIALPSLLFDRQRVVAVAAGGYHTAVVTESGALFTFGLNSHGQLARGTATARWTTAPGRARLPPPHEASRVSAVCAGVYHTAVLLGGGAVCSFGDNSNGQLGSARPNRAAACWDSELVLGAPVVQIACGEVHTVALTRAGAVVAWGANQLQQGGGPPDEPMLLAPTVVALELDEAERPVQVSAGGYASAVVTSKGRLILLGRRDIFTEEEEELSAGESGSSAQRRSRGDGGIAGDDEEGDDDAYDPGELEEDAEEF